MKRNKTIVWGSIALALLLVVVFETELLLPGFRDGSNQEEFAVTTAAELLTIAAIPLTLKFLRWRPVASAVVIGALLVVNTLLYYMYMNVAFGYMAIIALVTMPFVYSLTEKKEEQEKG